MATVRNLDLTRATDITAGRVTLTVTSQEVIEEVIIQDGTAAPDGVTARVTSASATTGQVTVTLSEALTAPAFLRVRY